MYVSNAKGGFRSVVIIEGPDGGGKTTLVNYLAKTLSLPRISTRRVQALTEHPAKRLVAALARELGSLGQLPYLYDRLYFSEVVYGNVLRGESKLTANHQLLFLSVVHITQSPTILCLPPEQVAYDNATSTNQMKGVVERYSQLYAGYGGVEAALEELNRSPELIPQYNGAPPTAELSGPPFITYDYTTQQPDAVIPIIQRHLTRRKEIVSWSS